MLKKCNFLSIANKYFRDNKTDSTSIWREKDYYIIFYHCIFLQHFILFDRVYMCTYISLHTINSIPSTGIRIYILTEQSEMNWVQIIICRYSVAISLSHSRAQNRFSSILTPNFCFFFSCESSVNCIHVSMWTAIIKLFIWIEIVYILTHWLHTSKLDCIGSSARFHFFAHVV